MKKESSSGIFGLGLLGLVVAIALVLRVIDFVTPDKAPTADVPSVTYDQITEPAPAPVAPPVVVPAPVETVLTTPGATTPQPPNPPTPSPVRLPVTLNLAVPFTSQAPFGKWDVVHEDTCEEAALYMALQYYAGVTADVLDPAAADKELLAMVAAEEKIGLTPSITVAEFKDFAASYSKVNVRVIENPTIDDIKKEINLGNPVLVPAAGRELKNPFFSGAGPQYHMFVIRGYTEKDFITNEPGTRQGKNYSYSYATVMEAIGDWAGHAPEIGPKRVMVIETK